MPVTYGPGGTWKGRLHALWGDGNPYSQDVLWAFQNTALSVAGPTPTQVGTTVGRLVQFRFERPITVANFRFFSLAAATAGLKPAIYDGNNGAQVWSSTHTPNTTGWLSLAAPAGLTLAADVPYWFGFTVNATSTVATFRTPAAPPQNSIDVSPPGSLNKWGPKFAQTPLTGGAWPTSLSSFSSAIYNGGATGTVPLYFADAA